MLDSFVAFSSLSACAARTLIFSRSLASSLALAVASLSTSFVRDLGRTNLSKLEKHGKSARTRFWVYCFIFFPARLLRSNGFRAWRDRRGLAMVSCFVDSGIQFFEKNALGGDLLVGGRHGGAPPNPQIPHPPRSRGASLLTSRLSPYCI